MDIEDELADAQAKNMGVIAVEVKRVTRKKLPRPLKFSWPPYVRPLTTLKFPAAIVKDRNIAHATVLVIFTRLCRDLGNANDKIAWALAPLAPPKCSNENTVTKRI